MEESNDGSLKLCSFSSVDGGRTERLPDNRLTDVSSNEERDTGGEAGLNWGRGGVKLGIILFRGLPIGWIQTEMFKKWRTLENVNVLKTYPDPSPYPFWRSSSNKSTISPEHSSWMMINKQIPVPRSEGSPYIPVTTYTTA